MPREQPVVTASEWNEAMSFAEGLSVEGMQALVRRTDMQWWVAESLRTGE